MESNSESKISLFSSNATYRKMFINSAINSLIIFILSYFVVYIFYQLSTIIMSNILGYDCIWCYDKIKFPLSADSMLWRRRYIILLFAIGPAVSFILASLFFMLFSNRNYEKRGMSMFLYWSAIHSLSFCFGAFVSGSITNDGLGFVISWLYIGPLMRTIYSFLAIIAMFVVGYKLTLRFFHITDTEVLEGINSKNTFTILLIFFPWFVGYFIISLIKSPGISIYDLIIFLSSFFLIAPAFSSFTNDKTLSIADVKQSKLSVSLIVATVILVLLYRIVLNNGIAF